MATENEMKELLTKNNQPIKAITQQDIYAMEMALEKLQSWADALEVLDKFFSFDEEPINKKGIVQKYHSNAQIFKIFFHDYLQRTGNLEEQLNHLRLREKIRIDSIK